MRSVIATRRGRRFATTRLRKVLRSAFGSLRQVAASPVKLILLVGGSARVALAYIGGLAASIQAFGGGVGIAEIGAVYMAASAIAAASPTPGGLGAIEAALIAGLTGVGRPPLPASHVLAAGGTRMDRPASAAAARLRIAGLVVFWSAQALASD